jgi:hypothetical protein
MFFKNCFFLSGVFTTFLVSLLANGGSFGQSTPIMAVWDDHDYGVNDGGGDFPAKEISRKAFLHFLMSLWHRIGGFKKVGYIRPKLLVMTKRGSRS